MAEQYILKEENWKNIPLVVVSDNDVQMWYYLLGGANRFGKYVKLTKVDHSERNRLDNLLAGKARTNNPNLNRYQKEKLRKTVAEGNRVNNSFSMPKEIVSLTVEEEEYWENFWKDE